MKYIRLLLTLQLFLCLTHWAVAQTVVNDSLIINNSGQSVAWYSLKNGGLPVPNVPDWDLAFQIEAREAGIRINQSKGLNLWLLSDNIEDWSKTIDTTGKTGRDKMLYNSDTSWNYGAFNALRSGRDPFDYGWGKYDRVRQEVIGGKIFLLGLTGVPRYRIKIDSIDRRATRYKFIFSDLNGQNEKTFYIDRQAYNNKNFVYFNLASGQILDFEPVNTDWDFCFTNDNRTRNRNRELGPVLFHNHIRTFFTSVGTRTAKFYPVSLDRAIDEGGVYRTAINTLGASWLENVKPGRSVSDSLVYFVQSRDNKEIYKLIVTRLTSGTDTRVYFSKQFIRTVSRQDPILSRFELYPNPAKDELTLSLPVELDNGSEVRYSISDMNGKEISKGLSVNERISVRDLPAGVYVMSIETSDRTAHRLWIKE